jgi:hypothetical protein
LVQKTVPPPAETVEEQPTASATSTETAPAPTQQAPKASQSKSGAQAPDAKVVAGLMNEADQARIAILAALNGGANIKGAMNDDNGAPVDLNSLANRSGGFTNSNSLVSGVGGGGPIQPGKGGGGLQDLHGGNTGGASTSAGQATKVVPVGNVEYGGSQMSVPVSNAEAVIRSQIFPGAKRCYQRGLEQDPTQAGKLVLLIKVSPSGEVDSASPSSNTGLSASVASCIAGVARRAKFDPPGANGSSISVPFNFVKQGS